ncbi:hypothetical protein cce_2418 [Crocosphaera subtropica ATCC 51142]|uniref:Polymerase nucleotidyl transferase domain-containing protein n=1 Tax=Crocosphaera subtropica (strain ATCC 51142 / BH68) TaxID=43989 RepID=B1WRB7_CROS5|nr:nucleotidyltransferase domain-containing protein [Crocosphaera subtropica]ACB51766.1 hypothetical protein cce_2418 [Crocosphaera subtropica ATCC 51142]
MNEQILNRLDISPLKLTNFCQENYILELSVFGSVLRDDFTKISDIDILVIFDPQIKLSLMDLVGIQYKLEEKIGRKVDLIEKRSIENSHNWIRRKNILETAQIIYQESFFMR